MKERTTFLILFLSLPQFLFSFHKFGIAPHRCYRNCVLNSLKTPVIGRDIIFAPSSVNNTAFDILDTKTYPPQYISLVDIKNTFINKCKEEEKKIDEANIRLVDILPLVTIENNHIALYDDLNSRDTSSLSEEDILDDYTVVTEQELLRIWKDASVAPFGHPNDQFTISNSLLLVQDEEDVTILSGSIASAGIVEDYGAEITEDMEIYITEDELKRIWEQRAPIHWGMPGKEFSVSSSLLLLGDDKAEEEYGWGQSVPGTSLPYTQTTQSLTRETEEDGFWTKYVGEDAIIQGYLKTLYEDLEDQSYYRPAWKKTTNILTPDIETQKFMGDIMNSNTYMTERIPANWNDPEVDEMSETYLSTATMAWPGQPEVDFNDKKPIWEVLNLPIGPKYDEAELVAQQSSKEPIGSSDLKDVGEIDWSTYDFGAEKTNSGDSKNKKLDSTSTEDSLDIDNFFRSMTGDAAADTGGGANKAVEGSSAAPAASGSVGASKRSTDSIEIELLEGRIIPEKPEDRPFVTPKEWLQKPEFANHVSYDVWGHYDQADFSEADDTMWPDDVYTILSIRHVMDVTDLYLRDHSEISNELDEFSFWKRRLEAFYSGLDDFKEPIPNYLTPDKDRGIEYSDDIIEMKAKKTLHPKLDPPDILWKNDTFTANEDVLPVMRTGTLREQYDWQPTGDPTAYFIDEAIVEKIQPVLQYANHLIKLKSTKDNVLLFEYMGQMRHIVGIREGLLAMARQCFPEVVDLRLETVLMRDKFDI